MVESSYIFIYRLDKFWLSLLYLLLSSLHVFLMLSLLLSLKKKTYSVPHFDYSGDIFPFIKYKYLTHNFLYYQIEIELHFLIFSLRMIRKTHKPSCSYLLP